MNINGIGFDVYCSHLIMDFDTFENNSLGIYQNFLTILLTTKKLKCSKTKKFISKGCLV